MQLDHVRRQRLCVGPKSCFAAFFVCVEILGLGHRRNFVVLLRTNSNEAPSVRQIREFGCHPRFTASFTLV